MPRVCASNALAMFIVCIMFVQMAGVIAIINFRTGACEISRCYSPLMCRERIIGDASSTGRLQGNSIFQTVHRRNKNSNFELRCHYLKKMLTSVGMVYIIYYSRLEYITRICSAFRFTLEYISNKKQRVIA